MQVEKVGSENFWVGVNGVKASGLDCMYLGALFIRRVNNVEDGKGGGKETKKTYGVSVWMALM